VRTDTSTMLTITIAQPFIIILKVWIIIVINYLFESIDGFKHWLTIVAETSLQPNRILSRSKHCLHKLVWCLCTRSELLMIISIHCIRIYPIDISQTLDISCFRVLDKIANEKASALTLHKPIMTLRATSSCSTSWTQTRCLFSY